MGEDQSNTPAPEAAPEDGTGGEEPIHAMQHLLDNHFLLLFLGVAMPTVLYTIWGVMEVVQIPISQ